MHSAGVCSKQHSAGVCSEQHSAGVCSQQHSVSVCSQQHGVGVCSQQRPLHSFCFSLRQAWARLTGSKQIHYVLGFEFISGHYALRNFYTWANSSLLSPSLIGLHMGLQLTV